MVHVKVPFNCTQIYHIQEIFIDVFQIHEDNEAQEHSVILKWQNGAN